MVKRRLEPAPRPLVDYHRLVLRVGEIAVEFGLTEGAIYQHVKRGHPPVVRLGRALFIPRAAVEQLLATQKRAGSGNAT